MTNRWPTIFAGILGAVLAMILVKLGNPVIFQAMTATPSNIWEVLFATWPPSWGYALMIPTILLGLSLLKFSAPKPKWILWLPLAWLVWVGISCANSVAPNLSRLAMQNFATAILLFYLGAFALSAIPDDRLFWRALVLGFAFILWLGLDQHYGGLEATRKAFMELPNWHEFPKEYQLRIQSNRIFSGFVYPNAFAGAILLWAPCLALSLWEWTNRIPSLIQKVLVGLFVYATAACLLWTGSKAGWLIALVVLAVGLLHLKMNKSLKLGIIAAVLGVGLAGFAFKYRAYFERGATSASARVIYWRAAIQIANARPFFGAGPGTFAKTFAPIKPPEAEMARLTHNDYLEQACDSGWPAFALFLAFIGGAVILGHRAVAKSPLHFAVWLGILGWALQSFVEFGLYIPAISWSAFLLLGWLLADRIPIDTKPTAR